MRYEVEFMNTALCDSSEIKDYLKHFYPGTVRKFVAMLEKSTFMLHDNPYIGTPYREYRKLVVGVYLVFYQVDETEKTVRIHRVLHGSRDIDDIGV